MNSAILFPLDALTGALFLLVALGIVAVRQVLACLRLFVLQSLLLAISAVLLGIALHSPHLMAVAAITIITKAVMIPWLLRYTVREEVYGVREIDQVLNIPTALLIAAALIIFAYAVASPLGAGMGGQSFATINLPIGIAVALLGIFTVTVRREAVPQLLGLLALENGVFFAGVSIVPSLSMIAELAAAIDVPVTGLVVGLLTRRIQKRVGSTTVGGLATLRED